MSKIRKHIKHQIQVNLFGLRDKINKLRKRRATKAKK